MVRVLQEQGSSEGISKPRLRWVSSPRLRSADSRSPRSPLWATVSRPTGAHSANVNASRLANRTWLDSVVMTAGNQRSGRLRARCDVCDEEFNLGDDVIATVARDRDYRIRAIEVFLYHADHWNPDAHRGEVKIIQGGFTEPSSAEED